MVCSHRDFKVPLVCFLVEPFFPNEIQYRLLDSQWLQQVRGTCCGWSEGPGADPLPPALAPGGLKETRGCGLRTRAQTPRLSVLYSAPDCLCLWSESGPEPLGVPLATPALLTTYWAPPTKAPVGTYRLCASPRPHYTWHSCRAAVPGFTVIDQQACRYLCLLYWCQI